MLEKMEMYLRREGSMKEGEFVGLFGKGSTSSDEVLERGGKTYKVKGGGVSKVDKGGEAVGAKTGKLLEGKEIEEGPS